MTNAAIDGVIFDAFGTIVRIGQRTNPYRELLREGRRQGVPIMPDCARIAMTENHSLDGIASRLGILLTQTKREELRSALQLELRSIQPFPDALDAIRRIKEFGMRVGICSNLAAPYGPIVRDIFPQMDGYAFSFELGIMKPDPAIYLSICSQMGIEPGSYFSQEKGRILMVGDSQRCDQDGPRGVGIMGFLLNRTGKGGIRDLTHFAQLAIDQNQEGSDQLEGQTR